MFLAVLGMLLLVASPAILAQASRLALEMAAAEVASTLQKARLYAVRKRAHVAVKFRTGERGEVTLALYRDGDGDGVRNADVDRGIDTELSPPRPVAPLGRLAYFGFAPGQPPRDPSRPSRRLDRLGDPIRFNRSDLASFTDRGTATPGTVYLTDGRRHTAMVRVASRAGRIRVRVYDPTREEWR